MQEKTWTHVDKSTWGRGPWQSEPDKAQWTDEATGFACLAVRGPLGAWCGYVGVTEGHPLFGVDDLSDALCALDAHGGLTFAGPCQENEQDAGHGICHVPDEGEPALVWWLGFDCAHFGDVCPRTNSLLGHRPLEGRYRRLDYVKHQCAQLAAQLDELKLKAF